MALSFQDKIRPVPTSTLSFQDKVKPVTSVTPEIPERTSLVDNIWTGLVNKLSGEPLVSAEEPTALEPTGILKTAGRVLANIPTDIAGLATGLLKAPGQTFETLLQLPSAVKGSLKEAGVKETLKAFDPLAALWGLVPGATQNIIKAMDASLRGEDPAQFLDEARRDIEEHPVGNILPYLGLYAPKGPRGLGEDITKGVKIGKEIITTGTSDLYKAITEKSPEQVDAYLTKQFTKGVRPSVVGKKTLGQQEAYQERALSGVKTIVENKPNLKILDEFGDATGNLPQTLNEFAQGIEQTRKQIFSQYDSLQKSAGQKGAVVELKSIATELKTISEDIVLQDNVPEIVDYVQKRAESLSKRGSYNTEQTQKAIELYNQSLNAFYKNPSYDTATKATVDAMIVNRLRSGLDSVIELTEGAGYQELKNKYGALKTIEKDVIHRSIVDARKNNKGLLDFTDIVSGADAIKGILTMNPAEIARAGFMKGIKEYFKYLNDPNTAIKKLFETAEKYQSSGSPTKGLSNTPISAVENTLSPTLQEQGKVVNSVPKIQNK